MPGSFQTAAGRARTSASRLFGAGRGWRLMTGLAVGLVAVLAVASLTVSQSEAAPPPLTLRGTASDTRPPTTDGLEFVPAPVIDFGTTTTTVVPATTTSSSLANPVAPESSSMPSADDQSASSTNSAASDDSADSADD